MRGLSALAVTALCIALCTGVQGRGLAGRIHTPVGYLPRHLAAEKASTPLSLDVLEPAETFADALKKAKSLHSALMEDRLKTLHNLFYAWAEAHEEYYRSEGEALDAFETFVTNVEHMVDHNLKANPAGHWRGLNKWSGIKWEKRGLATNRRNMLVKRNYKFAIAGKCKGAVIGAPGCKQVAGAEPPKFVMGQKYPKAVNWRTKGYTTPVKQQGFGCNSAWANAAATAVDNAVAVQLNTTPMSIARQALLSCINSDTLKTANSDGCNLGTSDDVFNFLNMNTAPPETKWPYTSGNGAVAACIKKYLALNDAKVNTDNTAWVQDKCPPEDCGKSGATYYTKGSALYTLYAVGGAGLQDGKQHPGQGVVVYWSLNNVSDADGTGPCGGLDCDFMNYQGGIFQSKVCPTLQAETPALNHAITIIGYNVTSNDSAYWVGQNSWGSSWGEQGLIKINFSYARTAQCGMYLRLMAPTLNFTGGNLPKKPSRFIQGTEESFVEYCQKKYKKSSQLKFCRSDPQCYAPPLNHCPEL